MDCRLKEVIDDNKKTRKTTSDDITICKGKIAAMETLQGLSRTEISSEISFAKNDYFKLSKTMREMDDEIARIKEFLWPRNPKDSAFWSKMKAEFEENAIYNMARWGYLKSEAFADPRVVAMCPNRIDDMRLHLSAMDLQSRSPASVHPERVQDNSPAGARDVNHSSYVDRSPHRHPSKDGRHRPYNAK